MLEKSLVQVNALVTRSFYGAPAELGFDLVDDDEPSEPTLLVKHRRVAGPFVAAEYAGVETTPYTGHPAGAVPAPVREPVSGRLEHRPGDADRRQAGGGRRGPAAAVAPPHALARSGRPRPLRPAAGERWLQVGGGVSALAIHRTPNAPVPPEVTIDSLPTVRFLEPLRGYEDYPIATDRIFIASADYRYPIIIDRGMASTVWILPSSFLRQVDLELFGSAATDAHGGPGHVGGGHRGHPGDGALAPPARA